MSNTKMLADCQQGRAHAGPVAAQVDAARALIVVLRTLGERPPGSAIDTDALMRKLEALELTTEALAKAALRDVMALTFQQAAPEGQGR